MWRTRSRKPTSSRSLTASTWSAPSHVRLLPLARQTYFTTRAGTNTLHEPPSTARSRSSHSSLRSLVQSRHNATGTSTTFDNGRPAENAPPLYQPPTQGILSLLPRSLVPFAELSRIDKPIGVYYLLMPCIWSTLLAAPLTTPITPPATTLTTSLLFAVGSFIMRGAGCTINDMWDRRLDTKVSRTRLRPLARGAVTMPAAVTWTGVQLLAGLGILLQFPASCFWYATPSLVLVALYPTMKRFIDYPQFVLGLTFSWGAIMGFPALGVDLMADTAALKAALALYGSNVAWTVLYDMVYAHQDLRDDKVAGIRSIARRWEGHTKTVLTGLAATQVGLLAATGAALGAGPVFYAGVLGGAVLGNGLQIWKVDLNDPADCWWWFRHGVWITGGGIALGISAEYLAQYFNLYDSMTGEHRVLSSAQ